MTAEEYLESLAKLHDRKELAARQCGQFDHAVNCQYYAACVRARQLPPAIRGTPVKQLNATLNNGSFLFEGDYDDPEFLSELCDTLLDEVRRMERADT